MLPIVSSRRRAAPLCLPLLLASVYRLAVALPQPEVSGGGGGDPTDPSSSCDLKCHHDGAVCVEGEADFGLIGGYTYMSPIQWLNETSRDGQSCDCPDGFAGVACKHQVSGGDYQQRFFHPPLDQRTKTI